MVWLDPQFLWATLAPGSPFSDVDPLGIPPDHHPDPLVLDIKMFPCVCMCASGSSQTTLTVHLLGWFGRRLTVCNCVFTQNRAALAGQGMGAYTHVHAISFHNTSQVG